MGRLFRVVQEVASLPAGAYVRVWPDGTATLIAPVVLPPAVLAHLQATGILVSEPSASASAVGGAAQPAPTPVPVPPLRLLR